MFKFVIVFSALLVCAAAKPGLLAPAAFAASPAVAYANAPLYAAGGSSQIDVRHNYDGTLSSYTTSPFNYAGPYASRYVAGGPAHYAAPAIAAAPAKYLGPAGIGSLYGVPHGAHYASPFAAQFAAPYASYATGVLA